MSLPRLGRDRGDGRAALLGIPHPLAALLADTEPGGPAVVRVFQEDVRDRDRGLALEEPALDVLLWVRAGRALDHVDALDDDASLFREHLQDLPLGALVLAGDHDDLVPAPQAHLRGGRGGFSLLTEHGSNDLWRERDDLHELLLAELAGDGAEDARPDRLLLGVDEYRGVRVESDVAAVAPPLLAHRADDDGLHDLPLLHRLGRVGVRLLDGAGDDVADAAVVPRGPALQADAEELPGPGVVCDLEDRPHLDHGGP